MGMSRRSFISAGVLGAGVVPDRTTSVSAELGDYKGSLLAFGIEGGCWVAELTIRKSRQLCYRLICNLGSSGLPKFPLQKLILPSPYCQAASFVCLRIGPRRWSWMQIMRLLLRFARLRASYTPDMLWSCLQETMWRCLYAKRCGWTEAHVELWKSFRFPT